jgi:malate dehydrogenase
MFNRIQALMSFVAIIGAGPLGGALAHTLAARDRVRQIRLIDPEERIAAGKALDISQSSPVDSFSTRVVASGAIASVAGAAAIAIADAAGGAGAEHSGETGLALLRQLRAVENAAPIVFAGANQRELMLRTIAELHVRPARVIGSAPYALESAVRALAGLAVDASGVEIALRVVGVPPRAAVVAWEEATAFGQPIAAHLAAHQIASLDARLPGLWPPGPYALASAATRVVEAIANGSRRRFSCFVSLPRRGVVAMPVELGEDGVRRVIEPALTRQERTRLENAIAGAE